MNDFSSKTQSRERYRIDNFQAKSLQNNPLNSPVNRALRIYLPPKYFESEERRYPVIYFLQGYGGNNHNWTITSMHEKERGLPIDKIPKNLLNKIDVDNLPTYEKLDNLIKHGDLNPFILVQPDGSLHLPNLHRTKNLQGKLATKGSFYINSPFTGNYLDYIVQDVIEYTDSHYRTISDKFHRAIMGGSMGGAGALRACLFHPEKFIASAALSPGNITFELLDWIPLIPLFELLFGKKIAKNLGVKMWEDILDTCDLIFSKENRLIPSIKRDENGRIIDLNEQALSNWVRHDINNIIKNNSDALRNVHLLIKCERRDEFGSAIAIKEIHETLNQLDIPHQFEIYEDHEAELSPHILGIAYQIIPAIHFCLQHMN
ncbi:MAG: alpha/beta hydrolase-fold protein [Promethearchaeota archaeon]